MPVTFDVERDGVIVATGLTEQKLDETGLTASTTYTYRVRARDEFGLSEWSDPFDVTTESSAVEIDLTLASTTGWTFSGTELVAGQGLRFLVGSGSGGHSATYTLPSGSLGADYRVEADFVLDSGLAVDTDFNAGSGSKRLRLVLTAKYELSGSPGVNGVRGGQLDGNDLGSDNPYNLYGTNAGAVTGSNNGGVVGSALNTDLAHDTVHTLRVEKVGNTVTSYVNGAALFSGADIGSSRIGSNEISLGMNASFIGGTGYWYWGRFTAIRYQEL